MLWRGASPRPLPEPKASGKLKRCLRTNKEGARGKWMKKTRLSSALLRQSSESRGIARKENLFWGKKTLDMVAALWHDCLHTEEMEMTYFFTRFAIQTPKGGWLNDLGQSTPHLTSATLWHTEREASLVSAKYCSLNDAEFSVKKVTLSIPPSISGPTL